MSSTRLKARSNVVGPLLAMAAWVVLVSGCASLPDNTQREPSIALVGSGDTSLGRALADRVSAHPAQSGIHPLFDARDAFAARILLARTAERSLDLQYYIWHDDSTGRMLFDAVWQAAERGVRVRLLLDDANTRGLDATLAVLDAHPNIELRLFNPFATRSFRGAQLLGDFGRINRRMHNKSFTADNEVAIVGGRNVGDEYYGADANVGFRDLDVLAIGAVVREVSREFDLYWNSEATYRASRLLPVVAPADAARLREQWQDAAQQPAALRYATAVRDAPLVRQLLIGQLELEWTTARVISDDPSKALNPPERTELHMLPVLEEALGKPTRGLDLVSPYFVPGVEGSDSLAELSRRGVAVRVLTNSLAATDVTPVHAGYEKYREKLLAAGIRLFELKPKPGDDGEPRRGGLGDSLSTGLHAKTISADRSRLFVGSFNLDPRSARLNTEMGMVIESPTLAGQLSAAFDTTIPRDAYEVRLAPGGGLEWIEPGTGPGTPYTTEPATTATRRAWTRFLSILPIEWLL